MILERWFPRSPVPIVSLTVREPGAVLDGKYEILRRLTGGGMSEVYLVRHLHLDERRVIKVLKPEDAADPNSRARFLRAARTATQIKHRNVAILYDYSSMPDGSFYMVWEYVDGEDVGRWLERHGPFPLDVAVDLGVQCLRGLEAIHSHGVIHRDISPDNLMLSQDVKGRLQLKIIDLGLAKNLHPRKADMEVTQVGMFMGKLRYCSPEQAGMVEGAILDNRTDLYSFAAVFYEMICGKPPFESETPHGYVFRRLTEDPLPLSGRTPGIKVPPDLDVVMRRALEKDRDKRYPSAISFIQALDQVRSQRGGQFSTQKIPTQAIEQAKIDAVRSREGSEEIPRPSSQLSRQERDDLLEQINRASTRITKTRELRHKVEEALAFGNTDNARRFLSELEALDSKAQGLEALKQRLVTPPADPVAQERLREAEAMFRQYVERHQLPLARLALETILDLAPNHPQRMSFEAQVTGLSGAVDRDQLAEKFLGDARAALARGDLDAATAGVAAIKRLGPLSAAASTFEATLAEAKSEAELADLLLARKQRVEAALAAGRLNEAEVEIQSLGAAGASRVTLDLYKSQLADAARLRAMAGELKEFEARFSRALEAGTWMAAREVAHDLDRALEGHPRAAEMLAEAEALRQREERRHALEQGERQLEALIAQGRADQAELTLKILLKMEPNHPRRRIFEKKIAAVKG